MEPDWGGLLEDDLAQAPLIPVLVPTPPAQNPKKMGGRGEGGVYRERWVKRMGVSYR